MAETGMTAWRNQKTKLLPEDAVLHYCAGASPDQNANSPKQPGDGFQQSSTEWPRDGRIHRNAREENWGGSVSSAGLCSESMNRVCLDLFWSLALRTYRGRLGHHRRLDVAISFAPRPTASRLRYPGTCVCTLLLPVLVPGGSCQPWGALRNDLTITRNLAAPTIAGRHELLIPFKPKIQATVKCLFSH